MTDEIDQPTDIHLGMKKIHHLLQGQQSMMIAQNHGKMIEIVRKVVSRCRRDHREVLRIHRRRRGDARHTKNTRRRSTRKVQSQIEMIPTTIVTLKRKRKRAKDKDHDREGETSFVYEFRLFVILSYLIKISAMMLFVFSILYLPISNM